MTPKKKKKEQREKHQISKGENTSVPPSKTKCTNTSVGVDGSPTLLQGLGEDCG